LLIFRRRLRADFYQMFALMVGVLVMTAILAGAPMYLSTIESLGLRSTLTTLSSSHRNMQIVVDQLPLTDSSVSAATERVDIALEALGDLVVSVGQESHTRPHFWATEADEITGGIKPDLATLQRFDGFLTGSEIVDGRPPLSSIERLDTHQVAEVVVPKERADELGIAVGQEIWLSPRPNDLPYLMVRVVGLFEANDPDEEFWLGLASEALEPGRPAPGARYQLPLFFTRDGLFSAVTGSAASIGTNRWLVQLDANKLERQSPVFTAEQVELIGHELRRGLPESKAISALDNPLRSLGQKIAFARIPTLMMGGVLLLAAGYYSVMAAGALMARRRVDTARMWARGSGRRQVAILFLIESVLLVLLSVLFAPFVAYGVIIAIGWLPEYEAIRLGLGMPVHLSWQAFAWSLLGGVGILGYMQWGVWKGGGRSVSNDQLSSRRVEGKPFFQRQYLDLLFFVFGGVVLWDLSTESSVATAQQTGDQAITVNPLLVFAPAIFLAVAVMLSLRILPPIARLASNGLTRRGPAWAHLISALFARVPLTYAWPAAILGMAAGTAMLSATVAATLEQSAADQSGYEVGADLRVFPVDLNSGDRTSVLDRVRGLEGVENASGGLRTTGAIRLGGEGPVFEFLAIEPAEFGEIGVFRDDYAEADIAGLLNELSFNSDLESGAIVEPLLVPESAVRIGFRMRSTTIERNIRASIRIIDANGLSHSVGVGPVSSKDWQVRMGYVSALAKRPVEVVGLTFFELTPDELGTPVTLQIDDLMYELPPDMSEDSRLRTAVTPILRIGIIESFDGGADSWNALASSEGTDTGTTGFQYRRSVDGASRLDTGLQIDLGVGTDLGVRGVIRSSSDTVPILFSQTTLDANNILVGDTTVVHVFGRSIPVRIVGVTDYFPTLNPDGGGFAVTDVGQLWRHLSLSSANAAGVAQEIFIGLDGSDDSDTAEVIDRISRTIGGLHSVVDREDLQRSSVVTPLAVAGWRGASIVTAALAIGLALLGFLTFAPMRPAGDFFNLAVLRTLGVRRRGLVFISVIEQLIVLTVGIAAGVGTGLIMARIAVDTASQTDSNVNSLPPIVFSTNWNYVGGLIGVLALAAIVIMILDIISVRRIDIAQTVRTSGKSG